MSRFNCFILIIISFLISSDTYDISKISTGRESDPRKINDISKFKLLYKKSLWTALSWIGPRKIANIAFPQSISHFDSNTMVALTIDDGFCGKDNPNGDMTRKVADLLNRYNAKATFFITGSHISNTSKKDINYLLSYGHEIANHNMYDIPYKNIPIKDFENDLINTKTILKNYIPNISNWYRAPHASISDSMHTIIKKYNLKHVIGDVFANDTSIPDPDWIANFLLKNTKPGSIIIIHMPEKGVREWNYEALEKLLIGLRKKDFIVTTLTDLESSN